MNKGFIKKSLVLSVAGLLLLGGFLVINGVEAGDNGAEFEASIEMEVNDEPIEDGDEVNYGETIKVVWIVENTGDEEGTQDVEMSRDLAGNDNDWSGNETISSDDEVEVDSAGYNTGTYGIGEYTFGIKTEDDSVTKTVEVVVGEDTVYNVDQEEGYDTIQGAIDDAGAEDTIVVGEGEYDEELTVDVEGLTIEGPNTGIPGFEEERDDEAVVEGAADVDADSVTINGLNFEMGDTYLAINGSGIDIRNNKITDTGGSKMALKVRGGTEDLTIEGNWFYETAVNAITLYAVDDLKVLNNEFTNIGNTPIHQSSDTDYIKDFKIEGNEIDNTGSHGINLAAISLENGSVIGNVMKNIGNYKEYRDTDERGSIQLRGGDFDDVTITDNKVSDSQVGLKFHSTGEDQSREEVTIETNIFDRNEIQVLDDTGEVDLWDIYENNDFDRAVLVKGSEVKVPIIFSNIQEAINEADSGNTVLVGPGTYDGALSGEDSEISVEGLTLKSIAGPEETTIDAQGIDRAIDIRADNVRVEGFTVQGFGEMAFSAESDGFEIVNNIVPEGEGDHGAAAYAVYIDGPNGGLVENNDLGTQPLPHNNTTRTISVLDSENIDIINNEITHEEIESEVVGSEVAIDKSSNITVEGNTVEGFDGSIAIAVSGFFGPTSDVFILNNEIKNNVIGVRVGIPGVKDTITGVQVNQNNIVGNEDFGVAHYHGDEVDATCNWWGTDDGDEIEDMVTGDVEYEPWLTEALETR